jgi:hypothetical protein
MDFFPYTRGAGKRDLNDSFAARFSDSCKTRGNGSERSGNLHLQADNDAAMRMGTK